MSRATPRILAWAVLAALAASSLSAAQEPRDGGRLPVIRPIEIPRERVNDIFPAGTPVRVMPLAEFEAIRQQLNKLATSEARLGRPLVIRAVHRARLVSSRLEGESELITDEQAAGQSVPLDPWSPAILEPEPGENTVATTRGGTPRVLARPESAGVSRFSWSQRGSRDGQGFRFELELIEAAIAELELETPDNFEIQCLSARVIRTDSDQAGGTRHWRILGASGAITLLARESDASLASSARDDAPIVRTHGRALLTTEERSWETRVDFEQLPDTAFDLELSVDAQVENLSVEGNRVSEFRHDGSGRLRVRLGPRHDTSSPSISVRGELKSGLSGSWRLPSLEPRDALWVGGTYEALVTRVVRVDAIEELHAFRVPISGTERQPDEQPSTTRYAFVCWQPGPPATLTLTEAQPWGIDDLAGVIRQNQSDTQFEARLTLRAWNQADRLRLAVRAGWIIENVQIFALDEPTTWSFRGMRQDGTQEVMAAVPSSAASGRALTALVRGRSTQGKVGELRPPRLLANDTAFDSEAWCLSLEPGSSATPTQVDGIAWIDPALPDSPIVSMLRPGTDTGARIAWRTVAATHEVAFMIDRLAQPLGITVWTLANVSESTRDAYWLMACTGLAGREAIAFRSPWPIPSDAAARVMARGSTITVPITSVGPTATQQAGVPEYRVEIPREFRGLDSLFVAVEAPRNSGDSEFLPIPSFDENVFATRLVLLHTGPGQETRTTEHGLQPVDSNLFTRELRRRADSQVGIELLPILELSYEHAWHVMEPADRASLAVACRSLAALNRPGLIEEAELAQRARPDGRFLCVLSLNVRTDGSAPLELELPADSEVVEARVDDEPSSLSLAGSRASIPLHPLLGTGEGITRVRLSYLAPAGAAGGVAWDGSWPEFSFPCITRRWNAGPGYAKAETAVVEPWAIPGTTTVGAGRTRDVSLSRRVPASLDTAFRNLEHSGETLGGLLERIDGPGQSVLIDSRAIRRLGLRFFSRARAEPGAAAETGLEAWLAQWKLVAVSCPGSTLVTDAATAAALIDDPTAVADRLALAVRNGYDAGPRWLRASLWRFFGSGPAIAADSLANPSLVRETLLARSGAERTPGPRLAPIRRLQDFLISSAVALLGCLVARSRSHSRALRRLAGLGVLLVVASALAQSSVVSAVRTGLALGLTLCAGYSLAWILPGPGRTAPHGGSGRAARSSLVRIVTAGLIGTAVLWLNNTRPLASTDSAPEILALLPYDWSGHELSQPTSAIMRLDDLEAIERYRTAQSTAQVEPDHTLLITRANHRATVSRAGSITLESQYRVAAERAGEWFSIPIGAAVSVACQIDGAPVAPELDPGRQTARIRIPESGSHDVTLRLEFGPATHPREARLPVAPVATSWYTLSGVPSEESPRGKEPLGPAGYLRLSGSGVIVGTAPGGSDRVEARLLWTIEPAGDRLEIRLDAPDNAWPGIDGLTLDGHWYLTSARKPAGRSATEGRPASLERLETSSRLACTGETPVESLVFWRPADPALTQPRRRSEPPRLRFRDGVEAVFVSAVRLIEPLKMTSPAETGAAEVSLPPASTRDAFLTSWGTDLDTATPLLSVASGPVDTLGAVSWELPTTNRFSASRRTTVRLEPSRVRFRSEVQLSSLTGHFDRLTLGLPDELNILAIRAEGMTDVRETGRGRWVLAFDGQSRESTRVSIEGWLPLGINPMAAATESRRLEIPSVTWLERISRSESVLELEAVPELLVDFEQPDRLKPENASQISADPTFRGTFRVRDESTPIRLIWALIGRPSRVAVGSHLAIFPETVTWDARVRYAIDHGPLHQLIVDIPSAWAENALFVVPGVKTVARKFQQSSRTRVEIQLLEPCWGEADLHMRSTLPAAGSVLTFPDLTPLGLGKSDTYIAWSNLSGKPSVAEGTSGTQPVDLARFRAWAPQLEVQPDSRSYHVLRSGWTLRIREPESARTDADAASLLLTSVRASLDASGAVIGSTTIDSFDRTTSELPLSVPERCEILGATVDGIWTSVYARGHGQAVIPVNPGQSHSICVVWSSGAPRSRAIDASLVAPVLPGRPGRAYQMRLQVPPQTQTLSFAGSMRAVSGIQLLEKELRSRLANIQTLVATLDRSDRRSRDDIAAQVVGFLMRRQGAARMGWLVEPSRGIQSRDSADQAAASWIAESLAQLQSSLAAYGLEQLMPAGSVQVEGDPTLPGLADPFTAAPSLRPEPLLVSTGETLFLTGETTLDRSPAIRLSIPRASEWPVLVGTGAYVLASGLFSIAVVLIVYGASRGGVPYAAALFSVAATALVYGLGAMSALLLGAASAYWLLARTVRSKHSAAA